MAVEKRILRDWIKGFMALTENSEPPVLYRIWTAVSVIAAVLQRKCFTQWERSIYPNMYVILVGPPGNRKGTAMGPGESLLQEIGVTLATQSTTRASLVQQLKEAGTDSPHASLTIFSKELIVFLGAKKDNIQLISDLTDWYDCDDSWVYKTKTQGEDHVIGVYVNLIGATTPDLIRSALPLEAGGGGLTSRMIFVYEDMKEKLVPFPFITDAQRRVRESLLEDLQRIYMMSGPFALSDAYIEAYSQWYTQQAENPPFTDYRFGGYFERRATHLRKLSMIMSASRGNDMVLKEEDFASARLLLERTEKRMQLTFVGVGKNPVGDLIVRCLQYIAKAHRPIRMSELHQVFYRDMDKRMGQSVLDSLLAMHLITLDNGNACDPTIHYNERARGAVAKLFARVDRG